MRAKIIRFVVYGVVVALLPIAIKCIHMVMYGESLSLPSILSNGELLLVTVALTAGGIGEVVSSGNKLGATKLLAAGGCVIILVLSAAWFGQISASLTNGVAFDRSIVASGSLIIFVVAFAASLTCVIAS
ncbi:MAG TPA: hypothetical protein VMO47_04475, partial [Rhodothermales bacterium]|nr:hypothetical protein [Rhodothermales bacterium]